MSQFTPTAEEGDPGRLAYLHNANWTPKLFSSNVGNPETLRRKSFCGGCEFGRPDLHEDDERCALWRSGTRVHVHAGNCAESTSESSEGGQS